MTLPVFEFCPRCGKILDLKKDHCRHCGYWRSHASVFYLKVSLTVAVIMIMFIVTLFASSIGEFLASS